jgi:hypothetical protein
LMDVSQQIFDLLNLLRSRLQNVRRTGVIVDDRDGEDLEGHLDADVPLKLVALEGALELGDRVVVFIGQLPPVGAQLRDVLRNRLLQLINQRLELFVDFGEVL